MVCQPFPISGAFITRKSIRQQELLGRRASTGHTWHYKKYADEQPAEDRVTYAQAEAEARAAKRGLWQDPNPTPPSDFRVEAKEERWSLRRPQAQSSAIRTARSIIYRMSGLYPSRKKNRVFFKTAAEAEAAGYTKAGNCKK